MGPLHLALEVSEVLSIVLIAIWGTHLMRQMQAHTRALSVLTERVAEVAKSDHRKMDELLLTQAVMLRRLDRIERRLPRGTN